MKPFSRVLAAVDFSKSARSAFNYALALSKRHGAELVVIQAVPRDQTFRSHARQRRVLAEKLRERAERANVAFKSAIQQGDPADIILLHASVLRPDVIVAGTHRRRGVDRLRGAAVAERIAAKATVPVLLVPPGRHANTTSPFKHLAVAVDFSAASTRAVDHALALASNAGDRVTLLHVMSGSDLGAPQFLYSYGMAEYQRELEREAHRRLQLAVPPQGHTAATVNARVLLGDTTTEISRVVEGIAADLLVVGVSRRGRVSRALFGTTAARLLRVSRVPVLAVPEVGTASAHTQRASLPLAA